MKKKKSTQNQPRKKTKYVYSKKWNTINLLPTVLLLIGTVLTVMFVSAKTYYDFRQRAAMPAPTTVPTPALEDIDSLSPTPTPTGFPLPQE